MLKIIDAFKHWLVEGAFRKPPPWTITAGGRTIVVQPLRVRQTAPFIKAMHGPYAMLMGGGGYAEVAEAYPDDLIDAVAVATDLERAFVADLEGVEFLRLAAMVIDRNLAHYANYTLPSLTKLATSILTGVAQYHATVAANSGQPLH